jgi:hypothetical protein
MKFRALLAALSVGSLSTFAQTSTPTPTAPTPAPAPASPAAPAPAPSAPVDAAKSAGPAAGTTTAKSAPATAKKDDAKSAVAKKAPPPAKKKEEPPAVVEGVAISRPNGGFLGLRVVNSNFVLTFYDAKKKKVAPDVTRAALRWPVKYQPGDERAVLNSSGTALTSTKVVRPPLVFKVFIGLYVEGNDKAVENYVVDYHGE